MIVNDELARIWEEAIMACLKAGPPIRGATLTNVRGSMKKIIFLSFLHSLVIF
jgi:hypothetical protein